jgi:hypothetical protein
LFAIGFCCRYNERNETRRTCAKERNDAKKSLFEKNAFANDKKSIDFCEIKIGIPDCGIEGEKTKNKTKERD